MNINNATYLKNTVKSILLFTVFLSYLLITYPSLMLLCTFLKNAPISNFIALSVLLISILFSVFLTKKSEHFFELSSRFNQLFLMLIPFFTLMSFLFLLRENTGIYDIFNPTDLLGLTERARQGLLPLSFTSFPDFPANYHQAFLILTGSLARFADLSALNGLLLLFPIVGFIIVIYVFLVASKAKSSPWIIFLAMLLFFFSTSLPEINATKNGSVYQYLLFIDIFFSNSWVLGTLAILMISLFFWKNEDKPTSFQWPVLILLLCLIPINATLFVAAWLSVLILAFMQLFFCFQKNNQVKRDYKKIGFSFLFLIILLTIYYSASYIPSAFLKGSHYSEVITRFKYLDPQMRSRDFSESLEALRLIGPWIFLLCYAIIPQKNQTFLECLNNCSFPQILFLFAVFFPLFISFENVDRWDAIHKFSMIGIIAGFLFMIQLLKEKKLTKNVFYVFVIVSFICSSMYLYNYVTLRLTSFQNAFWRHLPDQNNHDFITYLRTQKKPLKIHPVYQVGSGSEIAMLVSFSGNFMSNVYYPAFLVNITSVDWPSDQHWLSAVKFSEYLQPRNSENVRDVIVVEKTKNHDFLIMINDFKANKHFNINIDISNPLIFEHYVLYNYNSR